MKGREGGEPPATESRAQALAAALNADPAGLAYRARVDVEQLGDLPAIWKRRSARCASGRTYRCTP